MSILFRMRLHVPRELQGLCRTGTILEGEGCAGPGGPKKKWLAAHTENREPADLEGVGQALTPLYSELDGLKQQPWLSVQPRKIRQNPDALHSTV